MKEEFAGREVWLDWMRVAACFMVMVVHCTEPYYLGGDGGSDDRRMDSSFPENQVFGHFLPQCAVTCLQGRIWYVSLPYAGACSFVRILPGSVRDGC